MAFPNPSAHDQHRDFILRLREEYDSLRVCAENHESVRSPPVQEPAQQLLRAPVRRPSWASAVLEDDDLEPVYRSIGGHMDTTPLCNDGAIIAATNCFEGMDAMRSAATSRGPDSVDEIWLSRMPPLLTRQRGCSNLQ